MLDPVLLRSFVAVARTLSFTRAADRLAVRQSTVSQHVRKLEAEVGRTLLARDTHTVALTPDGEAMLEFATTILDTGERALAHFRGARVRGRLRFGVSEDLVLTRLPTILAGFRRRHPEVDLELTVGLSETLEAAGRPWRMACTSGSLSGLRAAALAGLGVVAHAETLLPSGLAPVSGLPRLGEFDFTLQTGRRTLTAPAEALAGAILDSAGSLRGAP
jgi:DNA-binding transcriptional LysR family regulator